MSAPADDELPSDPEPTEDEARAEAQADKLRAELDVLLAIKEHGVFWPGDA